MRWQPLALGVVSLVFCGAESCCGTGDYGVLARYTLAGEDCYYLGCPIAVGAEAQLFAVWTYGKADSIESASIDPYLAELELYHGDVLVRPTAPGTATLTVRLASGDVLETPLTFNVAVSIGVSANLGANTYPPGLPQAFAGSVFGVMSDYRDLAQQPMLGHGLDAWSITGGTLYPVVADETSLVDPDRVRQVIVGSDPALVVRAHPSGPPLEVDVLPAGSTRRIEVAARSANVYTPLDLSLGDGAIEVMPVHAYSADGRFIYGTPPLAGVLRASTDDPEVATAGVISEQRSLRVVAHAPGTTELTVTFDGVTRRYTLTVY